MTKTGFGACAGMTGGGFRGVKKGWVKAGAKMVGGDRFGRFVFKPHAYKNLRETIHGKSG